MEAECSGSPTLPIDLILLITRIKPYQILSDLFLAVVLYSLVFALLVSCCWVLLLVVVRILPHGHLGQAETPQQTHVEAPEAPCHG